MCLVRSRKDVLTYWFHVDLFILSTDIKCSNEFLLSAQLMLAFLVLCAPIQQYQWWGVVQMWLLHPSYKRMKKICLSFKVYLSVLTDCNNTCHCRVFLESRSITFEVRWHERNSYYWFNRAYLRQESNLFLCNISTINVSRYYELSYC